MERSDRRRLYLSQGFTFFYTISKQPSKRSVFDMKPTNSYILLLTDDGGDSIRLVSIGVKALETAVEYDLKDDE